MANPGSNATSGVTKRPSFGTFMPARCLNRLRLLEGDRRSVRGPERYVRGSEEGRLLMHHSIDIKSVFIGVLGTVLILCLVGAVPITAPEEYRRFQIATNDSHAFILDSATGQVWSSLFFASPETGIGITDDPTFHAIKTSHDYYGPDAPQ